MEPRPQRPRQPSQPTGNVPAQNQPTPQIGPDPSQHTQQYTQAGGQDPAAFVAPPRMDYDYSPLDLQPPGQRRKRQIIAGIIGALVVVAIGALIVAGWMALRDDDKDVDPDNGNDRVAELTSTETPPAGDENSESTPPPAQETATVAQPTAPPTATVPAATIYDENSIRTTLPVVESMPGPFVEAGDTVLKLDAVTDALGGTSEVQTMLADLGWQAGMTRNFESSDPETTGSTNINVSSHAFKDDASALAALPAYSDILEGFGWTKVDGEQVGDGSQILVWTDPATGEDAVTMYVADGQILYRVFAIGPGGVDSTPNAIYVAKQLVGP